MECLPALCFWNSAPLRSTLCHCGAWLGGGGAVKGRVGKIDIFRVHLLFAQPQALAKALEVDDLPLPQEADDVVHVRIIAEMQDVIVCDAGLLFWCDSVRTTFSAKVHTAIISTILILRHILS